MFDATQLGQITARWTANNQLMLTTPKWQHTCTADEVVSLLELLYHHKDAILEAAKQHDQDETSATTTYKSKPRFHVIHETTNECVRPLPYVLQYP